MRFSSRTQKVRFFLQATLVQLASVGQQVRRERISVDFSSDLHQPRTSSCLDFSGDALSKNHVHCIALHHDDATHLDESRQKSRCRLANCAASKWSSVVGHSTFCASVELVRRLLVATQSITFPADAISGCFSFVIFPLMSKTLQHFRLDRRKGAQLDDFLSLEA